MHPFIAQAAGLWDETPAITRCVLVGHCTFSTLGALIPGVAVSLQLSLAGAMAGHFVPLFTFWLVSPSSGNPVLGLLMLLVVVWVGMAYLAPLEREKGSLCFCCWFLVGGAVTGMLFLLLTLALVLLTAGSLGQMPCSGVWPLLVLGMTRRALCEEASAQSSMWGVCSVPSRWYPLALIGLFSLFSMQPLMDLLGAWVLAVGAHHSNGGDPLHPAISLLRLPLHRLLPSQATASSIEEQLSPSQGGEALGGSPCADSCKARLLKRSIAAGRPLLAALPVGLRQRYIAADSVSAPWAAVPQSGSGAQRGPEPVALGAATPGGSGGGAGGGGGFTAFSGGGHRLGEV